MLELYNISKNYLSGENTVRALDGVSIGFRKSEFVSVLGPSGCGKTTLLNIIGGLDRYSGGDLVIGGVSTKMYRESDWDNYRNHSIGFVFQSYNLIPHQTVLSNVELALTLSGVSKSERRQRAIAVLEKVGLGDQIKKKPNQMSGGQMQRVAIARALVNDPEILLADEPTGALDSETSVQIMELLKEIAKDRLIIMVTHNPELAATYSTRIVRLLDGRIVGDTNPCTPAELAAEKAEVEKAVGNTAAGKKKKKVKKPSMSLFTALSLSLNNLMTKKARTFLTSFAGSIGIIGIALILSLSSGINLYINQKQEETLASYPLSITTETTDLGALLSSFATVREEGEPHENDGVYSSAMLYKLINTMNEQKVTNDLKSFKLFLDEEMKEGSKTGLYKYVTALEYVLGAHINAYATDTNGEYVLSDVMTLFRSMGSGMSGSDGGSSMMTSAFSSSSSFASWDQMLAPADKDSDELVDPQLVDAYELLSGKWPTSSDEVILVLNRNNELSDMVLYSLGLKTFSDMAEIMAAAMSGQEISTEVQKWEYGDIVGRTFKLVLDSDYYKDVNNDGIFENISNDKSLLTKIISSGRTLKISGIVKAKEDARFAIISGSVGYTEALSREVLAAVSESEVVKAQQSHPDYDVLSGLPFFLDTNIPDSEKKEKFLAYCAELTNDQKKTLYARMLSAIDDGEIKRMAEEYIDSFGSKEALIDSLIEQYSESLGIDLETFRQTYGKTFEALTDEQITDMIVTYIKESNTSEGVLDDIISTPTEEEIDQIINRAVMMIKALSPGIDDSTAKAQIIVQYYSQVTEMSREYITGYVSTLTAEQTERAVRTIAASQYASTPLTEEQKSAKIAAAFDSYLAGLTDEELIKAYDNFTEVSQSSYDTNMSLLGFADPDEPSMINIYTGTFESKDRIADIISGYNDGVDEKHQISYTDYVALIMSSVTDIINAISYVLIAFVSISLVVSSIMIGIITYISVLERTKEIGILRSIGASKKDVSRVFNAETLIVGFTAGLIGIIVTVLLCFPINAIIHAISGVTDINAALPWLGGIVLVLISMGLTLTAGLIPSKLASKKDPVVALRTE